MSKNNKDDLKWEENDKNFYHKFLKLPESKDKKYYDAMKDHRMRFGSTQHRIDLRPKTFFSMMKIEMILLFFGIGFAITLPFYSQHLKGKMREPDELNIENIKNRVKSDPVTHEVTKQRLKIEHKLKTEYTKDMNHDKIKAEIEKTMKELYGDKNIN